MRFPKFASIAGLALVAAACADGAAPTAPGAGASAITTQSGAGDKITVCHAAGQAGTTHYISITVSVSASYAHIDEHGTPQAGHELDYIVTPQRACPAGDITFTKELINVFSGMGDPMVTDPAWNGGSVITIPAGETRWIEYRISYSLPEGVSAVITDVESQVCGTLTGTGWGCSFGYYLTPITVTGTGSILLVIDIANLYGCGDTQFTNTATLTPSVGSPVNATATVTLDRANCPTATRS